MRILGIHHASLRVRDLSRSRIFFEEILGLPVRPDRPNKDFGGLWYDAGPQQIHLIVAEDLENVAAGDYPGVDRHIALRVENLAGLIRRLEDNGIPYLPSRSGRPVVFCRDPDGNGFELIGEP